MKVYVSNRQTGKITKLIRESAKTGAIIAELHMMLWQLGVGIATLDSGHAKLMDFEMNNEED